MTNILAEINKRFLEKLETKTAWGKNECRTMYQTICTEVMSAALAQVDSSSVVFPEPGRDKIAESATSFNAISQVGPTRIEFKGEGVVGHICFYPEGSDKCDICGLKADEVF